VQNDIDFLQERSCEYAYEIDLDQKTVKIFVSGNNLFETYSIDQYLLLDMKDLEQKIRNINHY
jgi:hypothetical protein